jgi:hypothetical protein
MLCDAAKISLNRCLIHKSIPNRTKEEMYLGESFHLVSLESTLMLVSGQLRRHEQARVCHDIAKHSNSRYREISE